LNVPAGQAVQLAAAVEADEYCPAVQVWQVAVPLALLNWPAEHAAHDPLSDVVPLSVPV
jgi:hypothetical protein